MDRRRQFHFYTFTFRTIVLLHQSDVHLEDRLERRITEPTRLNMNKTQKHTLNILSLSPGRYEVCVNLFAKDNIQQQKTKFVFYFRSSNSCLHFAWQMPKTDQDQPSLLVQVIVIFATIALFTALTSSIYALHTCLESRKPPTIETSEDDSHRAKFLVHKHFVQDAKPFEELVRRRIHQRYAHHSPEMHTK